jgi:hypothetical protein
MKSQHARRMRRIGAATVRVAAVSVGTGVIAAGAALTSPGAAFAATNATVKLGNDSFGSLIIYNGGTGNANNLRIVAEGFKWAVTDIVPISASGGCVSVTSTKALCDKTFAGRDVLRVHVQLGDLADLASVEGRFSGNVFGDAGDDFMIAGQGDVGGHSRITYNGDLGTDTVSYKRSPVGVRVTKDDLNNDGLIGSFGTAGGDNIRDDVEKVLGSEFADQLTGDEKPNTFDGLGGHDTIDLGANVDRASGGAGNDTFRLKEGFVDFVDGSSGTDTATVDRFDSLTTVEIVN